MKKIAAIFVLSLGICAAAFAEAPDPTGKIDVSIGASGIFGSDSDFDDSVFVPVAVNYGLNPNWSMGLSGGWGDPEIRGKNAAGGSLDAGSVAIAPVYWDFIWRPRVAGSVTPYFDLGLGYMYARQHGERELSSNNLYTDEEGGFAVKLAAGADVFINDNWAYNFEGGYVWTDANVTLLSAVDGSETDEIDLSHWFAGAGLKYRFD